MLEIYLNLCWSLVVFGWLEVYILTMYHAKGKVSPVLKAKWGWSHNEQFLKGCIGWFETIWVCTYQGDCQPAKLPD